VAIGIAPIELSSGCGGSVEATLSAYIDPDNSTEILPTHTKVLIPTTIEIWSSSYNFVGRKQTFADQITRIAEDLMKELVNDWTTSQELFK